MRDVRGGGEQVDVRGKVESDGRKGEEKEL